MCQCRGCEQPLSSTGLGSGFPGCPHPGPPTPRGWQTLPALLLLPSNTCKGREVTNKAGSECIWELLGSGWLCSSFCYAALATSFCTIKLKSVQQCTLKSKYQGSFKPHHGQLQSCDMGFEKWLTDRAGSSPTPRLDQRLFVQPGRRKVSPSSRHHEPMRREHMWAGRSGCHG